MRQITYFENPDLLAIAAAQYFVKLANEQIEAKGKFTVALSGGNTPIELYKLLALPMYSCKINWKKVYVFWGDERMVPFDSIENNSFNAKQTLLDKLPIPEKNIFVIPINESPINAAIYYEANIKIFFKTDKPVFDLILLGMGNDGHTASLFPYSSILAEKNKLVKEVFLKEKNMYRISFTLPLINNASHKLFLVTGVEKKEILQTILNDKKDIEKYPAQAIEHAEWYISVE